MSEPIQQITLSVFSEGIYTIRHKHENFTEETYISHSHEGATSSIYNLLLGFLPFPADLHRKPGQPEPVYKREPTLRPLD